MSLVIRLTRMGKKGERKFRIVVQEKRSRRDGDSIDMLGWYEKRTDGNNKQQINKERFDHWVKNGAIPSSTVASLVKQA